MTDLKFSKFKNFVYFPDYAYKYLPKNDLMIPDLKKYWISFQYTFTNYQTYSPMAIKTFFMLESIYPRRAQSKSRLIVLRFTKTRCHSYIFVKINLEELIPFFSFHVKKPLSIEKALHAYQKQAKYFSFPGHISKLWFPTWERNVTLYFGASENRATSFFFHKTAFLD